MNKKTQILVPIGATLVMVNSSGMHYEVESNMQKEPNMEELLIEAKKRYPIGTHVKSLVHPYTDVIKHHIPVPKHMEGEIWFEGEDVYNLLIYSQDKWAEIISEPQPKFKVGEYANFGKDICYLTEEVVESVYCRAAHTANITSLVTPSTRSLFEEQFTIKGKRFNYYTLELENLDEFAHLPQKIEDLERLEGTYNKETVFIEANKSYAKNVLNHCIFPSKYAQSIQVQPKLLQLYEAWKDEYGKYAILLESNNLIVKAFHLDNKLFTFDTQKKAERFLELFKPELELYKPLMGGN